MQHYPLLTADTVFPHVVLADGDFPSHPIPFGLLSRASHLVCCDRAGQRAIERGLHPEAIVGDGDSIPADFRSRYASIFHHVAEQEDNDMTKATRYLLSIGATGPVCYLGATGKREDHTLANIALLEEYRRWFGMLSVMVTDHGWFVVAQGRSVFGSFAHQQVSIFNLSCRDRLSSTGLKWEAYPFTAVWQGSLNEAVADSFILDGDGAYLVFRTFEAKR